MAILEILEYPDPRLRTRASRVAHVDEKIAHIIQDMFDTMYAAPGIGLAATQVDVHKRMLVGDVSENRDEPHSFINPEIIERDGVLQNEEGCLSVPGVFESVERAECIKVQALDIHGESFELEAEGLLSICIQHEIDHLDGKLFVDYLSELKRERIFKRLLKNRKQRAGGGQSTRSSAPIV